MVVIDATFLLLLLYPDAGVPNDSQGNPILDARARIEFLFQRLADSRMRVVVPTPALSEVLVRAGAAASQRIVDQLQRHSTIRIESFDDRAAIEVASMTRDFLRQGSKKGQSSSVWAKVKYDRQIVAIAKVNSASEIYSDDGDIQALGKAVGIKVIGLGDIPLPPSDAQLNLVLPDTPKKK